MASPQPTAMSKHRVIVLGSGVSGLGCARELVSRGYEVLIVEARSRVGGRLKGEALELGKSYPSHDNSDGDNSSTTTHPIDLGGALIHGIDKNPIHTITTQMGVPLHSISDYCLLLDENGWPFDPKEDEKISNLFNECLDITFQRITEQDKTKSNATFGDLFDKVCREKGLNPNNPLLKWHQANLELPSGADFHELGYTWNDDEPYGFSGDHAAVETSWKFVMERLADGLNIMYNSPVTKVQVVLPDGTTPQEITSGRPEVVANLDKEQIPDTEENRPPISLPELPKTQRSRRSASKLEPTLPKRSSRRLRGEDVNVRRSNRSNKGMIQLMHIGDMSSLSYDEPTKKHIRQKRPRLETDATTGSEGTAEPPSSKVQITLQNGTVLEADALVCTLPLGVLKIPSDKPGHVSFFPPLPPDKSDAIEQLGCGLLNKCAMSFPNIFWQDSDFLGLAGISHSYLVLNATKYTQKPILIFMYGGSFAKELESWTDAQVVEDCLLVLRKICGKAVTDPVDYCVTRWGLEQFSRMAFTYIPPGVDGPKQLAAAGEAIYDPVLPDKPLIMFAGEHTTPYHPSTMHGAFLSGIREAYRYDLYVDPSLELEFENDDRIYEYTFVPRKVYKKTKKADNSSESNEIASNDQTEIRSRRRRFAGMALRKQPKQVLAIPSPQRKNGTSSSDNLKSRRSQRSLAVKRTSVGGEEPSDENNENLEEEKQKLINDLEDRTLVRSLESYGRDCGFIRSNIVPVFGSKRRRTADQIRSRWQQLVPRRKQPDMWKSWVAENIAPTPMPNNVHVKRDLSASGEEGELRRSNRAVKPKVLIDI